MGGKMRLDEFHQAMLERKQQVEEAVDRAQKGEATENDWIMIRYECGIGAKNVDSKSK
jgi:hypothetical protein